MAMMGFKETRLVLLLLFISLTVLLTQHGSSVVIAAPAQFQQFDPHDDLDGQQQQQRPSPAAPTRKPGEFFFYSYPETNRFVSPEAWRPAESIHKTRQATNGGAVVRALSGQRVLADAMDESLLQSGEQLSENFVADSANILVLVKTSSATQWERLPMHFLTTFTKLPNFAIYSDSASSVVGYEVIDVLAETPEDLLTKHEAFDKYREARVRRQTREGSPSLNGADAFQLDRFKPLLMLQHAFNSMPEFDWYVVIDDSTFVFPDNLAGWLNRLDPKNPVFAGVPRQIDNTVFAHDAAGMVLSRAALKNAFGASISSNHVSEYLTHMANSEDRGDFTLARYLKDVAMLDITDASPYLHNTGISKFKLDDHNWCTDVVTIHTESPQEVEILWEYTKLRAPGSQSVRRTDIYADFIKPYLPVGAKPFWDNFAKDKILELANKTDTPHTNDPKDQPWDSLENCQLACEAHADCLMWRWQPQQCGISRTVSLGIAAPGDTVFSGWMLTRIREMRHSQKCDILYSDRKGDGYFGGLKDQFEGWWWREVTAL